MKKTTKCKFGISLTKRAFDEFKIRWISPVPLVYPQPAGFFFLGVFADEKEPSGSACIDASRLIFQSAVSSQIRLVAKKHPSGKTQRIHRTHPKLCRIELFWDNFHQNDIFNPSSDKTCPTNSTSLKSKGRIFAFKYRLCFLNCSNTDRNLKTEQWQIWAQTQKWLPSNRSEFLAMRCTFSTIYLMIWSQLTKRYNLKVYEFNVYLMKN